MPTAGRPTKYTMAALKRAQVYVQKCRSECKMPFMEELSLELEVNDDTLVEWCDKHEEFSATIKRLKLLQKLHLKKDALERKIHPTMSIFLLKANHGLDEKEPEREWPNITVTYGPSLEDSIIAGIEEAEKRQSEVAKSQGSC